MQRITTESRLIIRFLLFYFMRGSWICSIYYSFVLLCFSMFRKNCSTDLEQQNGRGLRQGNMFQEVGIYHYVTENTFDAYMLGIITNKAKFINQVMTSKEPARVSEDVDEMVLTYSEMQAVASGNPLIKEKIELDNEISGLKMLESEYHKNRYDMQELAERTLPETIRQNTELLKKAESDLQTYKQNKPSDFEIRIEETVYNERAEAGKAVEKALIKCSMSDKPVKTGEYAGFELSVEYNHSDLLASPYTAVLKGELRYSADISLKNDIGNIRRIENLASSQIEQRIEKIKGILDKARENLEAARDALSKPFEYADKLADKINRLNEVNHKLGTGKAEDDIPVSDEAEPKISEQKKSFRPKR